MIASRQPKEIQKIVERYNKQLEDTEASFMDIVIKSGGLLSYAEVMTMPIDSISLFAQRINKHREEQNQAAKQRR